MNIDLRRPEPRRVFCSKGMPYPEAPGATGFQMVFTPGTRMGVASEAREEAHLYWQALRCVLAGASSSGGVDHISEGPHSRPGTLSSPVDGTLAPSCK